MKLESIDSALNHWAAYVLAKKALLDAGIVRSFKAAEADMSEWLVATVLGGSLSSSRSHPSWDVLAADWRIQVKSICKAPGNPNGYIVSERDRLNDPKVGASHYAFVFFNDLTPEVVFLLPEDVVRCWSRMQLRRADVANHPKAVQLWPLPRSGLNGVASR